MSKSVPIFAALGLLATGCGHSHNLANTEVGRFTIEKKRQTILLAQEQQLKIPRKALHLFDSILADDWNAATNLFAQLQLQSKRSGTTNTPAQWDIDLGKLQNLSQKFGVPAPKVSALEGSPWHSMVDATAALYQWRCVHASETQEKQRMLDEALLAYEQSFALDPTLVMDFADMLIQINQSQSARRLLQLSFKLDPDSQVRSMIDKLDRPENK